MSVRSFNFKLGNRPLTSQEWEAVEIALNVFRESLESHGKSGAGFVHRMLEAIPREKDAAAEAQRSAPDTANIVPATWTTNMAPSRRRRY